MRRRAIVAALGVLALAGCAHVQPSGHSTYDPARFDRWVAANVHVVEYQGPELADPPPECAGHVVGVAHTMFIDETCTRQWINDRVQARFWWYHEACHDALVAIGYGPFGFYVKLAEHNANTCAVAVSGIHPTLLRPDLGYDDPTAAQVARMRWVLHQRGLL